MTKQKAGDRAREKILDAALQIWPNVTITAVAERCRMTPAAIFYHFPGRSALRAAAVQHAIESDCSRVIVQLIASKDPAISKMSAKDRIRHFNSVN